jgi:hypothetical protein
LVISRETARSQQSRKERTKWIKGDHPRIWRNKFLVGKRGQVDLKRRGSTDEKALKAPIEVKVCGGALEVSGFIKNVQCLFVVDIGADVTIVSEKLYENVGSTSRKGIVTNDKKARWNVVII